MKKILFWFIFIISFSIAYSKDTLWVAFENIELPYKWEIYGNLEASFSGSILRNGNVTVSFPTAIKFLNLKVQPAIQFNYSLDTFHTWNTSNLIQTPKNDKEYYVYFVSDQYLFPNNRLLMATDTGYFIETTDFGKTFTYRYDKQFEHRMVSLNFKDSLNGFLKADSSWISGDHIYHISNFYKTTDGGYNWKPTDLISKPKEFANVADTDYIVSCYYWTDDGTKENILVQEIYICSKDQEYFRFSKDDGVTWSELRTGPEQGISRKNLYIRNDSIWYTSYLLYGAGDVKYDLIYLSPDLGKTWITQMRGIVGNPLDVFRNIIFYDNSPVGFVSENLEVMMTFNCGKIWTPLSDSIAPLFGSYSFGWVQDSGINKRAILKINNQMIFFANRTVLRFVPLGPLTGIKNEGNTKTDFIFFFNPSINAIEVKSEKFSKIDDIKFYDLEGRLLYSEKNIMSNPYYINRQNFANEKIIFAVIQTGKYVFYEKILCE